MRPAPWSPMVAPPLPCANDLECDTCEHAYPRGACPRCDAAALLAKMKGRYTYSVRRPDGTTYSMGSGA